MFTNLISVTSGLWIQPWTSSANSPVGSNGYTPTIQTHSQFQKLHTLLQNVRELLKSTFAIVQSVLQNVYALLPFLVQKSACTLGLLQLIARHIGACVRIVVFYPVRQKSWWTGPLF